MVVEFVVEFSILMVSLLFTESALKLPIVKLFTAKATQTTNTNNGRIYLILEIFLNIFFIIY